MTIAIEGQPQTTRSGLHKERIKVYRIPAYEDDRGRLERFFDSFFRGEKYIFDYDAASDGRTFYGQVKAKNEWSAIIKAGMAVSDELLKVTTK